MVCEHYIPLNEIKISMIFKIDTICPGSSDSFFIVTNYIKWVNTSWTHSTIIEIDTIHNKVYKLIMVADPDPYFEKYDFFLDIN